LHWLRSPQVTVSIGYVFFSALFSRSPNKKLLQPLTLPASPPVSHTHTHTHTPTHTYTRTHAPQTPDSSPVRETDLSSSILRSHCVQKTVTPTINLVSQTEEQQKRDMGKESEGVCQVLGVRVRMCECVSV